MDDVAAVAAGLVLAGGGGELFVRGAVGLASWARVPARVIATTVAAFATSSPEFVVSTSAALAARPEVGLGGALGSNVVNVGFVMGLAVALTEIRVERGTARRDVGVAVAAPVVTGALVLDGTISRGDGAALVAVFVGWLAFTVRAALRDRSARGAEVIRPGSTVASAVAGLVMLVLAGRLVVAVAKGIGDALGLDTFVVGASMVAIGTSLPELATTLSATLRGRHEVGLGTILGSNIFNGLWIVGVTALITPIQVDRVEALVALTSGLALVALLLPGPQGRLRRRRGALLLVGYAASLVVLFATAPSP